MNIWHTTLQHSDAVNRVFVKTPSLEMCGDLSERGLMVYTGGMVDTWNWDRDALSKLPMSHLAVLFESLDGV